MNPVILFLIFVVVVIVAVLALLLRPLLRQGATASAAPAAGQTNVQALRVELAEARRDHGLGLLSDAALAEAERELEARVLAEAQAETVVAAPRYKRTAIALGLSLPVLAIAGYAAVGTPVAVVPEIVRPPQAVQAAGTPSVADQQMDELFRLAEERLKQQPDDVKGWTLLARAKASVGLFDGAIAAYEKAVALDPKDSELWSDFADAAAGKAQGNMEGKPVEYANKALALDGRNPKALLLRGTWEIQTNKLGAAEKSFTLARSLVEASSGFAQIADNALADIKSRRGGPTTAATASAGNNAAPAAAADAVVATVQLKLGADAQKAAQASPTAAVFVIVRAAGATAGPPLAAKKVALADLGKPVQFTAADAMIGGAGLKAGADVTVQARLSLAGQPAPTAGDWQSARNGVKLPVAAVALTIEEKI